MTRPRRSEVVEAQVRVSLRGRPHGRVEWGHLLEACEPLDWSGVAGIHAYAAQPPIGDADLERPRLVRGTGVSCDPESARAQALSEALERYCALAAPDPAALVRAAFRDLSQAAVEPSALALHTESQYQRTPGMEALTPSKCVDWCEARSVTSGQPMLVPNALVRFAGAGRSPNNFLAELTSTGLASHVTAAHAALHGLYEVIERDSLAVAWHTRLPAAPVDPSGTFVDELRSELESQFRMTFTLYQLPTDVPLPVLFCVGWSDDVYPHAVTGCACRSDPLRAANKALLEAVQMRYYLRRRGSAKPQPIRDLSHHAAFYGTRKGALLLRHYLNVAGTRLALVDGPTRDHTGEVALALAASALSARGLEALVADIATPTLRSLGLHVVRVLVPSALDIAGDPRLPRFGARRLYEVPSRLRVGSAVAEADLNRLPIPLA